MSVRRKRSQVEPTVPGRFVAYLRTSRDDQRIGIEAQRSIVDRHATACSGSIIAEFVEHASGADKDRPQLAAALEMCRETGSTLIVGKQCRLSRDVEFTAWLIKQNVPVTCCDAPYARTFELHLRAALNEEERRLIAARTSEALQALKAKGVDLGARARSATGERIADLASRARTRSAIERAWRALPAISRARDAGCLNVAQIAQHLHSHPTTVARSLDRTVGKLFAA